MKKLKIGIVGLVMMMATQTLGCGASAGSVARHTIILLGQEVFVRCIFDDCGFLNSSSGQSLTQTIEDYYSLINQGKYDLAWDYLSPNFKARSEQRGGYTEYYNFWRSIDSVTIKEISLFESSEHQVYVDADLKYFQKDEDTFSHTLRLSLIWNEEYDRWAIDSAQILD